MSIAEAFALIFPSAMLLFGAFKLYFGARAFLNVQKMENTATSKASSAAMGLVELYGKASGENRMEAPLSGTSCVFWKVYLRQHDPLHNSSKAVASASSIAQFSLNDGTGSVSIDSPKAEVDLLNGPSHTSFLYSNSPENPKSSVAEPIFHASQKTGMDIREGINDAISGGPAAPSQTHLIKDKRVEAFIRTSPAMQAAMERYTRRNLSISEYAIKDGDMIYVLGTLSDTPSGHAVIKGKGEGVFIISDEPEMQILKDMRMDSYVSLATGAILMSLSLAAFYVLAASLPWA